MTDLNYSIQEMLTTARSSLSPFDDLPLDPTKRMFRLWKFKPRASNDELHLELASFTDTCPFYIALSYTWGNTSPAHKRSVNVNHGHLSITENLWDFLLVLELNGAYNEQWFWADQICINQTGTSEQNHQVSLMGEIYSTASIVFTWLGAAKDLDFFDLRGITWDGSELLENHNTAYWRTLLYICTQEYWKRLWVVQELKLAQKIVLWCRSWQIEPRNLLNQLAWIPHRATKRSSLVRRISRLPEILSTRHASGSQSHEMIADQMKQFRAIFEPRLRALLEDTAYVSNTTNKRWGLIDLLATYAISDCTDVRDKVFGLQSLVVSTERVQIDYTMTIRDLSKRVAKAMVRTTTLGPRISSLTMIGQHVVSTQEFMQMKSVMLALHQSHHRPESTMLFCWAHLVPRIPADLHALDRNRQQSFQPWLSWPYLWQRVEHAARTKRQKDFSNDILQRAEGRTREVTEVSIYDPGDSVSRNWQWYDGIARQAEIAFELIDRVAADHGFVMFGDFMFHPDDYPFCGEESSSVLGYLIQDAMREGSALE